MGHCVPLTEQPNLERHQDWKLESRVSPGSAPLRSSRRLCPGCGVRCPVQLLLGLKDPPPLSPASIQISPSPQSPQRPQSTVISLSVKTPSPNKFIPRSRRLRLQHGKHGDVTGPQAAQKGRCAHPPAVDQAPHLPQRLAGKMAVPKVPVLRQWGLGRGGTRCISASDLGQVIILPPHSVSC